MWFICKVRVWVAIMGWDWLGWGLQLAGRVQVSVYMFNMQHQRFGFLAR